MLKPRYLWLDGSRGIAALIVLLYHLRIFKDDYFSWGWICVDYFFMLSGFVLAKKITDATNYRGSIEFLKTRIFRLWPVLIVACILQFIRYTFEFLGEKMGFDVGVYAVNGYFPILFMGALGLLQIFSTSVLMFYIPLWSLSAEWWVNVLAVVFKIRGSLIRSLLLILIGILLIFGSGYRIDEKMIWSNYHSLLWAFGRALISFNLGYIIWRYRLGMFSKFLKFQKILFSVLFILTIIQWIYYPSYFLLFGNILCILLINLLSRIESPRETSGINILLNRLGLYSFGVYAYQGLFIDFGQKVGEFMQNALILKIISVAMLICFTIFANHKVENVIRLKIKGFLNYQPNNS